MQNKHEENFPNHTLGDTRLSSGVEDLASGSYPRHSPNHPELESITSISTLDTVGIAFNRNPARELAGPSGEDALGHKGSGVKNSGRQGVRKHPLMSPDAPTFEAMCSLDVLEGARNRLYSEIPRKNVAKREKVLTIDLLQLRASLLAGSYRHRPCNARWRIVGGGRRLIDSPSIEDRIVQRAYVDVMAPLAERLACSRNHGYRSDRSIHTALWSLVVAIESQGYSHLFRTDIEGFFKNVPHSRMAEVISRQIADLDLRAFSLHLLNTASTYQASTIGLPTGWLVNPLWSNLLLSPLDFQLEDAGLDFIRYVDDYAFLQFSAGQSRKNHAILLGELAKLGLTLKKPHSGKTYTRKIDAGVLVLGHEIKKLNGQVRITVSKKSTMEIHNALFGRLRRLRYAKEPTQLIKEIVDMANGWSGNAVQYPGGISNIRSRTMTEVNEHLLGAMRALPDSIQTMLTASPLGVHIKQGYFLRIRPLEQMRLITAVAA